MSNSAHRFNSHHAISFLWSTITTTNELIKNLWFRPIIHEDGLAAEIGNRFVVSCQFSHFMQQMFMTCAQEYAQQFFQLTVIISRECQTNGKKICTWRFLRGPPRGGHRSVERETGDSNADFTCKICNIFAHGPWTEQVRQIFQRLQYRTNFSESHSS